MNKLYERHIKKCIIESLTKVKDGEDVLKEAEELYNKILLVLDR